jgi:hypothetical protein
MSAIEPRPPELQSLGGIAESEWDGDRDRGAQKGSFLMFSKPLEQDIAAEGETDCRRYRLGVLASDMFQNAGQVARIAGMIPTSQAVRFTAAATKMHENSPKSGFNEAVQDTGRIVRLQGAFQSVQYENTRAAMVSGPGQIDKVSVGQFDSLPGQIQRGAFAE